MSKLSIEMSKSEMNEEPSKSALNAEPSSPTKRRDFSVGEKVELLIQYDALPRMSQAKAARELGISKQLMCRILQHRADIMQSYLHNRDTNRKRKRCGKDGEVETALKDWFDRVSAQGTTVTGPIMRKKAEELAKELGKDDFVATDGWFSRWRKRENIVLLGRPRCESNLDSQPGQWSEMLAAYSAECVYGTENASQIEQEFDTCNRTHDLPDTSSPQKFKEVSPPDAVRGIAPHCSTKRRDLSVSEKLEILAKYDGLPQMSQSLAASQLGVSQPLLCKILKTRHDIEQESLQHSSRKRKRCGKDGEVETALKEWFEQARRAGTTLTGPIMRKKAEELARELGKEDFIATDGWFSRWRKRENITTPGKSRATCEPTLRESNNEQPAEFCDENSVDDRLTGSADTNAPFDEVVSTNKPMFPVQCVYGEGTTELDVKPVITSTTDERVPPMHPTPRNSTPALPDDFPPDNIYTIEMTEIDYLSKPWCSSSASEHEFPLERLGILCCVSIGGHKQKLLVVGQRDNQDLKTIRQLPVDYYYNEQARITPHIIFDWLMKWDRNLDHEIIMMMDDYHNLRTITSFKNLIFQPVDKRLRSSSPSISANLKSRFTEEKKQYLKWTLARHGGNHSGHTPRQSIDPQKADFISLLHIIAKSWEKVSQSWLLDRFMSFGFPTTDSVSRSEDAEASQLKIEEFDDGASSPYLIVDQNECGDPSNQELQEALSVLTRAVYHRADEFNLHYQYETFIKSLQ